MYIIEQQLGMNRVLDSSEPQVYPTWLASKEYKFKDKVTYEGSVYLCVVSKIKGVNPQINSGKWLNMGPANRYAAFDQHTHTSTVGTKRVGNLTHLDYTLDVSGIEVLALIDLYGEMLTLTYRGAHNNIIKSTQQGIGSARLCADSWYDYYFCDIPAKGDFSREDKFITDIPARATKLEISITSSTVQPSVGMIAGGHPVDIGRTEYSVSAGLIDDGVRKKEGQSGEVVIVREEVRDTMTLKVSIPAKRTMGVRGEIKKRMNQIMLFVGDPSTDSNYENLLEWGFIRSFDVKITNQLFATAYLTIEEII